MGENGDKPKKKTLKDRLTVVKIGLGIGVAILAFFGIKSWWDLVNIEFNTVIVLDGSAAMGEWLADGTQKFEAAKLAIENTHFGKKENIALRLFGGPCNPTNEEENTWRVVGFGKNNKGDILNALNKRLAKGLKGKPALTSAITEALQDDLGAKHLKGKDKKMIIIAAGACPGNPAREIRAVLTKYDSSGEITREIQLIGMGVPENQRDIFRELAHGIGNKALFVDDRIDLEVALYNAEIANTFLLAKENWLFKKGRDKKAAEYLTIVVDEGRDQSEIPPWAYEAMRLLGEIYLSKKEPHDEQTAINWFAESAEGGNARARATLASMILKGNIESQRYPDALGWLTEAANSGNPEAMYVLGRAYDEGTVWQAKPESALTWYTKAKEAFEIASERTPNSVRKQTYKTGYKMANDRIESLNKRLLTKKNS